MRKKTLLMLLCCVFAVGACFTSLHAANGVKDVKGDGGYVLWTPLLLNPEQIGLNSHDLHEGGGADCLIDGNINTLVHSIWHTDMQNASITEEQWLKTLENFGVDGDGTFTNKDAGYHFVQANVIEPVSTFKFTYKGRNNDDWHDNPNHFVIYGTNNDGIGSDPTNKNQDQWTFVTELTPENGNFPPDVKWVDVPYESPVIEAPEAFKYYRFVIKGTTKANSIPERTFNNPDVTGVTWGISEFQILTPTQTEDYTIILPAVIDSIADASTAYNFELGTDPGYTNEAVYNKYFSTLEECQNLLFSGETDNGVLKNYCDQLRNDFANLVNNGVNRVETGYYFIHSAYGAFKNRQGVGKSMCVDSNKKLIWAPIDTEDATQLWYIEELANGNHSIKNVASGEYIATVEGAAKQVQMSATHEVDQVFKSRSQAPGKFVICNVLNDIEYHADGHGDGNGVTGRLQTWTWPDGDDNPSRWYVKKVTDQATIDKLVNQGANALIRLQILNALQEAKAIMPRIFSYDKLITDVDQLSTNCQSTTDNSDLSHLIDGDYNTIFHSAWEDSYKDTSLRPGDSYGWHNLQVRMKEPVQNIRFSYVGRYDDVWHDNPDHITIYGTNDDELGASTASADSTKWTQILDMTRENYNFPINIGKAVFDSPEIDLGAKYKYLRFVIKHVTTLLPGGIRIGAFPNPFVTGVIWNVSEFQIHDVNPNANSQYIAIPGMKEAADLLLSTMTEVEANMSKGIISQEDLDKMNVAMTGIDSLYVDRHAVMQQINSLLESSKTILQTATGERVQLVNKPSQLKMNSNDPNEGGHVENLLDKNKGTCVHTVWCGEMANTNITESEWLDILSSRFPESVGIGYHNLQVELAAPQKSFFFEFFGRTGTDYHDNPDNIDIYATNDAGLADDISNDRLSNWTFIKNLSEGFPGNVEINDVPYTSPVIELGGEYKYIRFVVKHTSLSNTGLISNRDFGNPDVTGIAWNLSEFQMYTGLDPESIQYNYVPEVRAAVDHLNELTEKYGFMLEEDIISAEPVTEIQNAIKALNEAYVDTTAVVELYSKLKKKAVGTEEGEEIGNIDVYDEIGVYDAALDAARATVSLKQPTKAQIKEAIAKMNEADAAFMSHINMFKPYEWYNLRSNTTRDYGMDQPIFLSDVSTGAQLCLGGYPIGNEYTDVYAIWRVVPVDTLPGTYAIQSLGTGQYFGAYRGDGFDNRPLMSHDKTPYVIEYCGNGAFYLRQANVENEADNLKADGYNNTILNFPVNSDRQQEWKFGAVANETDVVGINWYPANNVNIITLPWANKDAALADYNPGIETYGVNSVVSTAGAEGEEGTTTLTLTKKDNFEAGEPIVLVTPVSEEGSEQFPLTFALPAAEANGIADTSAVVANGLVGTLQGMNIVNQNKLYFQNSELKICGDAPVWIAGRGGYIDAALVQDLQGSVDKTITIGGVINNVENIEVEDANALVNVYTIDGVMVKQNVKAINATKNLAKGIYVVGKKKVLVK